MCELQTWLHVGQTKLSMTTAGSCIFGTSSCFSQDVNAPCFKAVYGNRTNLPPPWSLTGYCFPVAGVSLTCFKSGFSISLYHLHWPPLKWAPCFSWSRNMALGILESAVWMRCPYQCSWALMSKLWMPDIQQWLSILLTEWRQCTSNWTSFQNGGSIVQVSQPYRSVVSTTVQQINAYFDTSIFP